MTPEHAEYVAAWQQLKKSNDPAARRYVAAREALAKAHPPKTETKPAPRNDAITVPFGRDKGKLLRDVDERALRWLADATRKSIADPSKERFRALNQAFLDALKAELAAR